MRNTPTRLNGKYSKIEAWNNPTGASLCVYSLKAKGKARAVIHINHGLADHGGRYARFAQYLSKAGFHVYAHDHRGHGATTAPDAPQGVFAAKDGWDTVLADIKYVNSHIHKKHPNLPLIMFGHSMGGMLAYNYLLRWPETIDGAAIWNAAMSKSPLTVVLKLVLGIEKLFKGRTAISVVSKMTFETFNKAFKPNITSADWLSKDEAECRAYEDDPDGGWAPSVSMWQDLRRGIVFGANDTGLENVPKKLPIYILGGDADPSVEKGKATHDLYKRLETAGLSNVKLEVRKNGRHEALNEPKAERDAVMQRFVEWVNSVI
ncbi:MAG: alpha/beta hydrolase [Robiginitomaculum sp.]|nr:alpha/beta hydrolase [Robiginitomaculum sp.]